MEEELKDKLAKIKMELSLEDYLSSLGHSPQKRFAGYLLYRSPFRQERTASFKVDLSKGLWVDFGETSAKGGPLGGDLITLMKMLHGWSSREVAEKFGNTALAVPVEPRISEKVHQEPANPVIITNVRGIYAYSLVNYALSRGIPRHILDRHCKEVHYQIAGRNYFGIGFKNDIGGWEIRNQYAKRASSPKGVTTVDNGCREVCVFEGFFDYLTFLTRNENTAALKKNFAILNSAVFFPKLRPFLEAHSAIYLYLDHDNKGRQVTREALATKGANYVDASKFFAGDKMDFNRWHMQNPKPPKLRRGHRF
ncbi:toprim domain-containing protein [Pedobacter paludis]|uniref:DNA primase n=1 Tax=Pedobacter paludis TaxID=2203212 RepID=A0A317F2E7_9SPHI|nr:toprim domain-containing protein [Pedobacter paludis]PWS32217.1 DNA primase [Pedobacter paludis]